MTGFEFPIAGRLLLRTLERRGLIVLAYYVVRYAQSLSCQSLLDFEATFFNRLHNVLLKGYARPFAGAWYIDHLCCSNLNFSEKLIITLLTNGLPLSIDNVLRHTISRNDVSSNEVNSILLFNFL